MPLSEVNDVSSGKVLCSEHKLTVRLVDSFEIAYHNVCPVGTLPHLYLTWRVRMFVDGDVCLLYTALLVLCRHVHDIVAFLAGYAKIISTLVHGEERVRVHAHALGFSWCRDIHLIG